jgi:translation initiation factor IF-3
LSNERERRKSFPESGAANSRNNRSTPKFEQTRVNEQIRAREVLVIDADGSKLGVVTREAALAIAEGVGLDLVEVAANVVPPVCRIGNWSKMKYEQSLKEKAERRNATRVVLKEIKLRPRISDHDLATKIGQARNFLESGHKVKITVMFRGREISRPEAGIIMLEKAAVSLADVSLVDSKPVQIGRDAFMTLSPQRGSH